MLHYELFDFTEPWKPKKNPIVFVHGISGDNQMWFYQIPEFSKHFPIITVDLPGHGKNPHISEPISIEEMAEQLFRTLQTTGINKFNFIGISLGGIITTQLAAKHPEMIDKLVIVGTPRNIPEEYKSFILERLNNYKNSNMREIMERGDKEGRILKEGIPVHMKEWSIDYFSRIDYNSFVNIAFAPLNYDINSSFKKITAETLILASDTDPFLPVIFAMETQKDIKNSEIYIFKDTGHISNIENPKEFNDRVLDFLLK